MYTILVCPDMEWYAWEQTMACTQTPAEIITLYYVMHTPFGTAVSSL